MSLDQNSNLFGCNNVFVAAPLGAMGKKIS
jgi:hypothetical protein